MVSVYKSEIGRAVNSTLVLVLAGGQGSRLHELTNTRAKPCLEFGASYRLIDFPLSNCINSGLKRIGIVTQYKSQSLLHHLVGQSCQFNNNSGEFLELLPASQQHSKDWYSGTADALYQNIDFIKSINPQRVLVLSGDHIYKMDYRNMLEDHIRNNADMTVSCIEVPIAEARGQFGVMSVNDNQRIDSFEEKPLFPKSLEDNPGHVLASMGNYVFNTDFLIEKLQSDALNNDSQHDFGKDIIPKVISESEIYAFRFRGENNAIPYWKDVGTLDSYWSANMDLLDNNQTMIMPESYWPICSAPSSLPPSRIASNSEHSVQINDSMIGNGCELNACDVEHSIISDRVTLQSGASIEDSLLLPEVTIGENCQISNAIIDAGCVVPADTCIGLNKTVDEMNGFRVTEKGVTLATQAAIEKLKRRAPLQLASSEARWNACVCAFKTKNAEPLTFSHLSKSISIPELKYLG